jgi:protein-tyrosine kinase
LTVDESKMVSLVERAAARLRAQALQDSIIARPLVSATEPGLRENLVPRELPEEPHQTFVSKAAEIGPLPKVTFATRSVRFDPQQLKRAAIVDHTLGRSRQTEELRVIKRQLLSSAFPEEQSRVESRSSVIMVTSARPHEGKTFTTLSLAMSIARDPNHYVLLVDTDGSPAGLSRFFVGDDVPGLLDVVGDPEIDVSEAILHTDIPKLSVVLAGLAQNHGPELLASRRMRSLINEMAIRYEDRVVLIDAPPCLVSSDPATLAGIVDQVVLVVEADRTQREEVEAAIDLLHACPRISLVLNKTKIATSDSFGPYTYR